MTVELHHWAAAAGHALEEGEANTVLQPGDGRMAPLDVSALEFFSLSFRLSFLALHIVSICD